MLRVFTLSLSSLLLSFESNRCSATASRHGGRNEVFRERQQGIARGENDPDRIRLRDMPLPRRTSKAKKKKLQRLLRRRRATHQVPVPSLLHKKLQSGHASRHCREREHIEHEDAGRRRRDAARKMLVKGRRRSRRRHRFLLFRVAFFPPLASFVPFSSYQQPPATDPALSSASRRSGRKGREERARTHTRARKRKKKNEVTCLSAVSFDKKVSGDEKPAGLLSEKKKKLDPDQDQIRSLSSLSLFSIEVRQKCCSFYEARRQSEGERERGRVTSATRDLLFPLRKKARHKRRETQLHELPNFSFLPLSFPAGWRKGPIQSPERQQKNTTEDFSI